MVEYSDKNSSVFTKYMQKCKMLLTRERYINRNHRPRYASDGPCLHKTEAEQTQPCHFRLIRIVTWLVKIVYDIYHNNDVIMNAMASQITGVSIVYPTVCLGADHKKSKLCVTGLFKGNSPVTDEFPTQRVSNAENVSIWWRHHVMGSGHLNLTRLYRIISCIISCDLPCLRIPKALQQNMFHSVSALFLALLFHYMSSTNYHVT